VGVDEGLADLELSGNLTSPQTLNGENTEKFFALAVGVFALLNTLCKHSIIRT